MNNIYLAHVDAEDALRFLKAERERRAKIIWTMNNGQDIDVRDMSDEHLQNSINMLERIVMYEHIIQENTL